jgi:hypothetical protein
MDRYDNSIRYLLDKNNDQAKIEKAFALIIRILRNIILHPLEPKYRTVKSTSTAFRGKIGELVGGDVVMTA